MKVRELAEQLNMKVISGTSGIENEITGGYSSDLLSDVLGHAQEGNLWITLQTHKNVMAIASLKDLAGVVLVNNNQPEQEMIDHSNEEHIPVMLTKESAFSINGKIYNFINIYNNLE
ncbi:MAG TPA: DRTGG domain-containing protein [Lentimicrobium sp.]|nr:DRTGG domain-containing protein [Lentimicrobium sp.]